MFRNVGKCLVQCVRSSMLLNNKRYAPAGLQMLRYSSTREETDDEFDARYEAYFNRPEIDEWEIRKAMNDLQGMDLVPEPKIIIAALKACRRLNDYALAVRFLEGVKKEQFYFHEFKIGKWIEGTDKCGGRVKEIYPYILQEIRPTLDDLGVLTPEEMGYDKPELYIPDVFEKPLFRKRE